MSKMNIHRNAAGFGLIEVLAAVLVLAVGVIGFAALQLRSVQTSGDAYYRTQAMAIAQDLAERIRVNNTQIAAYRTSTKWPTTTPTLPTACNGSTADCSYAAMVDFDALSARYNANALLPQGLVNVEACQVSTTMSCIYVAWDGLLPTAGGTGQCVDANGKYMVAGNRAALPCVMLEVQ